MEKMELRYEKSELGERPRGANNVQEGFVEKAELENNRIFLVLLKLPLICCLYSGLLF